MKKFTVIESSKEERLAAAKQRLRDKMQNLATAEGMAAAKRRAADERSDGGLKPANDA